MSLSDLSAEDRKTLNGIVRTCAPAFITERVTVHAFYKMRGFRSRSVPCSKCLTLKLC